MRKPSQQYLQGFLAAIQAVAEITGKQKLDGMSDREWKLINEIHARLASDASAEAIRLEQQ
jgi:hypothetical protein